MGCPRTMVIIDEATGLDHFIAGEWSGLLTIVPVYGAYMNASNLVDLVKGLVAGMEGSGKGGPYRITVPHGTNLGEHEEGENATLEHRLKDIEGVKEVVVGKNLGTSIEQCEVRE